MLAGLLIATGCTEETAEDASPVKRDTAPKAPAIPGNWQKYSDDTTILRCGTNEFTLGEAKILAKLHASLARLSTPSISKEAKLEESFIPRVLASIPHGFTRDCSIVAFAAEKGIAATDADIEQMQKNAMRSAKQDFISWPGFMRKLPKECQGALNKRVEIEALTEAVRKWHVVNMPAPVSEEELVKFRQHQREYNRIAAMTNDLTFAQATNVWQQIKNGLAFEEAVDRYSTDENDTENGEWGDFNLEFFDDTPAIQALLPKLVPGDITEPIEGDNGLMIMRLDDVRDEGDGKAIYSVSRIFFHLPEFYPELDDETFAKEIREARQKRTFGDFVDDLTKKQNVTYPIGEFIFEDAKRTSAQPVMF